MTLEQLQEMRCALELAERIENDVAVRAGEDLRAGFSLQNLSEILTGEFEEQCRRRLPLSRETRLRVAIVLRLLVKEITYLQQNSGESDGTEGTEVDHHAGGGANQSCANVVAH